jgi:hypothetical protein
MRGTDRTTGVATASFAFGSDETGGGITWAREQATSCRCDCRTLTGRTRGFMSVARAVVECDYHRGRRVGQAIAAYLPNRSAPSANRCAIPPLSSSLPYLVLAHGGFDPRCERDPASRDQTSWPTRSGLRHSGTSSCCVGERLFKR